MAGPFKATILYNTADAGWTETHFIPGASLSTAQGAAQTINTSRLGLAGSLVKCGGIRVVDVTTPRLGYIQNPSTPAGTYTTTPNNPYDPAWAILLRLVDATGLHKGRHFIRGVPFNQVPGVGGTVDPFTWVFTADFNTALTAYTNSLVANANLAHRVGPGNYQLFTINSGATAPIATVRKAGRPFFLRRGRRLLV